MVHLAAMTSISPSVFRRTTESSSMILKDSNQEGRVKFELFSISSNGGPMLLPLPIVCMLFGEGLLSSSHGDRHSSIRFVRVCAEIPFAGARLLEAGTEQILRECNRTGLSPDSP